MDPKSQDSQNPDPKTPSNLQSIIPFTSITLSFPKFTPTTTTHTHLTHPPPPPKTTFKIPSQIQSIFNLSLSSSTPITIPKSTLSITPLQYPHSPNPTRPSDPSNAAALRRVSVVWFRSDLRLHDNESLTSANNQSISVLPLYCFDPNNIGANSASFLIESVSDLRKSLRAKGSDLVIRVGKPESVLPELAKQVGAEAVYMHREVSNDEIKSEAKVETLLKDQGVEVKAFWGSTLYNVEDLPFQLDEMPTNYAGFKEKVKGVKVRSVINVVDQMKGLPSCGNVDVGELPSLADFGITQVKPVNNGSLIGGETEALNRLKRFATECRANPPKETKDENNDSVYGASFSCKISPWLALGCVSPRAVFDEFKKSASRTISAGSSGKDGDSGMNWLMYELVWRDFFRFITRKCSSSKQRSSTPVTVTV
ncbi:blue-light photoreceptor PHR2-like [Bidens hawaiensis]|uniref:blue-light photoreceptor PHR2-like n=1 Tax=Bidens hawaiensis TaxID=980011 RepID=UPI00404B3230